MCGFFLNINFVDELTRSNNISFTKVIAKDSNNIDIREWDGVGGCCILPNPPSTHLQFIELSHEQNLREKGTRCGRHVVRGSTSCGRHHVTLMSRRLKLGDLLGQEDEMCSRSYFTGARCGREESGVGRL